MAATGNGRRKAHHVAAKVDADLKKRIEAFAAEHGLEQSEAVRTLLSFAVMQNEDPKTRVMYALYNNLNMQCNRLLQDGLKAGMLTINQVIQNMMAEQEINIPD